MPPVAYSGVQKDLPPFLPSTEPATESSLLSIPTSPPLNQLGVWGKQCISVGFGAWGAYLSQKSCSGGNSSVNFHKNKLKLLHKSKQMVHTNFPSHPLSA